MKCWLLIFILIIPVLMLTNKQMLRNMDNMHPLVPSSEFAGAKAQAKADLEAFIKKPGNTTYANLNTSLERLGDIAGYTHPNVCRKMMRSVTPYRDMRRYLDWHALKKRTMFYCG